MVETIVMNTLVRSVTTRKYDLFKAVPAVSFSAFEVQSAG